MWTHTRDHTSLLRVVLLSSHPTAHWFRGSSLRSRYYFWGTPCTHPDSQQRLKTYYQMCGSMIQLSNLVYCRMCTLLGVCLFGRLERSFINLFSLVLRHVLALKTKDIEAKLCLRVFFLVYEIVQRLATENYKLAKMLFSIV